MKVNTNNFCCLQMTKMSVEIFGGDWEETLMDPLCSIALAPQLKSSSATFSGIRLEPHDEYTNRIPSTYSTLVHQGKGTSTQDKQHIS